MRRKSSRRRKDDSDSNSSSSDYQDSAERPEQLYKELKAALVENERPNNVYRILYKLERNYKDSIGVLRVSLPGNFNFNQNDMEEFFKKYGKVEKIVVKQSNTKVLPDEQPKAKEVESIAYIIYTQYCSAILALKVINSMSQKQRIIQAKICHTNANTSETTLFNEPLIDPKKVNSMILEIERDYQFGDWTRSYKYMGTIGLDFTDKQYRLRERILGVEGCNFVKIHYICEKMFKFEHQDEESRLQDLVLKLVVNKSTGLQRQVLILSHSLQKYNQAVRSLHELLEQIVEQYKNSRQKLIQIIPKDIHIRKWQKFSVESQLKFLT